MILRIARVQITRFRGFESFVLLPREHVVVVGEPRAGRSDLVAALPRVLEPRSVMSRPSELDVFRPLPKPPLPVDQGEETATPLTYIEISLLQLADETEQVLQDRLELLSPTAGEIADEDEDGDAELGVRLRYCLRTTLMQNISNIGSSTRSPMLVSPVLNESFFAPLFLTETNRCRCALRERCVVWPITWTLML